MPPDIRELYGKAIKALRTSKMTHDEGSLEGEGMSSGNLRKKAISYSGPGPIEPQSSFSSYARRLIIGAVIIGLITGLYFLMRIKIAPAAFKFLETSGDYHVYFYRDADGDGRGDHTKKILGKLGEEPPVAYTVVVGDCDDHNPNK